MKKFVSLVICLVMILGIFSAVPFAASADTGEVVINISKDDIYYSLERTVQSALNEAAQNATEESPYRVVIPAGEYTLTKCLNIYSNTTLDLTGVTLVRHEGFDTGNMLRVGDNDSTTSGVTGFDAYKNIKIVGGTFNGNYGNNTIIKAFHTTNFTMENVTVLNESEGHMTEFAAVDGLTFTGCTFKDQRLTVDGVGYEAIQIDVLHPAHIVAARCEDLPCKNILVENCTFDDLPRAVGSHTAVLNAPHENITIKNNTFTNMRSIAIQGLNWKNVNIYKNVIDKAPRGITIYSEPGPGGTYLSSTLAKKGGTTSHYSDSFSTPGSSNINIYYNVLKNIGTVKDIYATYSCQGIAVLGQKLTKKSAVDKNDEAGGLPAGDYYVDDVYVHDNYIDVRGNGIRMEDVRGTKVTDNVIVCSKNTVGPSDNYYGIVFRNNFEVSSLGYNAIKDAEVYGMHIDGTEGGSIDKIRFNYINGTGDYGIRVYNLHVGQINDNDILNTGGIGLFLNNSYADKIMYNRIRDCDDSGIWITSDSKESGTISGNTTKACSGNNSYGSSSADTHYTSSATLKSYNIPWAGMKDRVGARMSIGSMFHIVPDVTPDNAIVKFTYSSSDTSVVKVDKYGMVYGVSTGRATVTVTPSSSGASAKKYVVAVEGNGPVSGTGDVVHVTEIPEVPTEPETDPVTEPQTETETSERVILGDIDGDGKVTTADATRISQYLAKMDVGSFNEKAADVDGDGNINVVDASRIQQYLARLDTESGIGEPV